MTQKIIKYLLENNLAEIPRRGNRHSKEALVAMAGI